MSWMGHRMFRRPWAVVTWVGLLSICWAYPSTQRYIILGDSRTWSLICLQCAYLWCLVGGVLGLGALEDIEPQTRTLTFWRRWRIRGALLGMVQVLPALPMVLPAAAWSGSTGGGDGLTVAGLLVSQTLLAALVVDRIAPGAFRPGLYLTLLWLVPALEPQHQLGASRWLGWFAGQGLETENLPDSPLCIGWVGSMLALAGTAFALDLLRRPAT